MKRRQHGFSGLLVLAALALLGGLGVWASGLAGAAADSATQALGIARAQEAAAAGADWARWRLRVPAAPLCSASSNVALPGAMALWTVTTRCTAVASVSEGGATVTRWRVVADACNQPQGGACPSASPAAGYVQATRTVWVERP